LTPPPANLVAALNISPAYVGKNRLDYLVEVDSENTLRHLEPDFRLMATVPCRGVIVTSRPADPQFDFVSRAFFPRLGVDEDPVCGSAHCCLVNFWRKRLGKSEFVAFQVSARSGVVKVRVVKDRVFLSGNATTVAKGELCVEQPAALVHGRPLKRYFGCRGVPSPIGWPSHHTRHPSRQPGSPGAGKGFLPFVVGLGVVFGPGASTVAHSYNGSCGLEPEPCRP
jgi:hypothetical protein